MKSWRRAFVLQPVDLCGWHTGRLFFFLYMPEYLFDHLRVFNTGNDMHGRTNAASAWMRMSGDFDLATAVFTHLYINLEYPLEALRLYALWAQLMEMCRSAGGDSGFRPLPRPAGVTCARYALLGANTP
jgi:hypothetical protein